MVVISTAKKFIRKENIPGWLQDSEELFQNFLEKGDQEKSLPHGLDATINQKMDGHCGIPKLSNIQQNRVVDS